MNFGKIGDFFLYMSDRSNYLTNIYICMPVHLSIIAYIGNLYIESPNLTTWTPHNVIYWQMIVILKYFYIFIIVCNKLNSNLVLLWSILILKRAHICSALTCKTKMWWLSANLQPSWQTANLGTNYVPLQKITLHVDCQHWKLVLS